MSLHQAIEEGQAAQVEALVAGGADVNAANVRAHLPRTLSTS